MSMVVIGATFVDMKGFPFNTYIPDGRNAGKVEIVHGGVGRNIAEDIGNLELRPKFLSLVDDTPEGEAVLKKLNNHRVNTDYVLVRPEGMGIWLAIFDNTGDLAGSVSRRPDMLPLADLIEQKGDEIFADAESIILEIDIEKEIVKQVFRFAEKYGIKVYAVVSNMSIALERRDFIKKVDCFICNELEAGIFFADDYSGLSPEELEEKLAEGVRNAQLRAMVVTMGGQGSVYADNQGDRGFCPSFEVKVRDTSGAGDAFGAGVAATLTYGGNLKQAVQVGTRLAASVITVSENVCPRFLPKELGINAEVID